MKQTIVFFDHFSELSGAEKSLLDILVNLPKDRLRPVLVCLGEGSMTAACRKAGIEVFVINAPKNFLQTSRNKLFKNPFKLIYNLLVSIQIISKLSKILRNTDAKLLVSNTMKAHVLACFAGAMVKIPVFWYFRDIIDKGRTWRLLNMLAKRYVSLIITNSNATAKQFVDVKTEVVYPGIPAISAKQKKSWTAEAAKIRKRFELKKNSKVITIVSQIARWKGLDVFINAAKRINKRVPQTTFLIVGSVMFETNESVYFEELKKLVENSGLSKKITFTGRIDDIMPVFMLSEIILHTSTKSEPFGRVLIEAMSLSKPVVATKSGGPEEIIEDGVNGILAPSGDEKALASAVCKLLKNKTYAQQMGKRGEQRVKKLFTTQNTVRKLENLFKRILKV